MWGRCMRFNIEFNNLNDALKGLSYARVYQSPLDKSNFFNIEVEYSDGGNYAMLENLIELAKKEGFKYDKYYGMNHFDGDYTYTAIMYSEDGDVECNYYQNSVRKI